MSDPNYWRDPHSKLIYCKPCHIASEPEKAGVRETLRKLDAEASAWWTAQIQEFQASGRALPPGIE
jgi:hypothetical protein